MTPKYRPRGIASTKRCISGPATKMSRSNPRPYYINCHVPRANDPGKDKIVMVIEKNTAPEEDECYELPTILREYNNSLLAQKDDGLGYSIRIIDS